MPEEKSHPTRPAGHVIAPAMAIGGLSLLLAAGLELLGTIRHLDAMVSRCLSRHGEEMFPNHLPQWSIWLAATLLAFGLSLAILGSPGNWRRLILWITTVVLTSTWAPVLSLAAYSPEIAIPWIATLWSGICAIVYASNHRMDCDTIP